MTRLALRIEWKAFTSLVTTLRALYRHAHAYIRHDMREALDDVLGEWTPVGRSPSPDPAIGEAARQIGVLALRCWRESNDAAYDALNEAIVAFSRKYPSINEGTLWWSIRFQTNDPLTIGTVGLQALNVARRQAALNAAVTAYRATCERIYPLSPTGEAVIH